jgi:2'-5' RNA ligase
MSERPRLFLAINLPEAVRASLYASTAALRRAAPGMRWVSPDGLHVTLKFLGSQPAERVEALRQAMDIVASRHAPTEMMIRSLGAFPNLQRPRVVWIGIEPNPRMELLHHEVEMSCQELGYALDGRVFRPHVTLARSRAEGGAGVAEARRLADAARGLSVRETATLASIDLMESLPARGGSRYSVLASAPLRSA